MNKLKRSIKTVRKQNLVFSKRPGKIKCFIVKAKKKRRKNDNFDTEVYPRWKIIKLLNCTPSTFGGALRLTRRKHCQK